MTLNNIKKGTNFKIVNIEEKGLNNRLLSLGICKGECCTLGEKCNGNVILKTLETKIALSINLADKIDVEVI